MKQEVLIFWLIVLWSLTGLVVALRDVRKGITWWVLLYAAILLVNGAGWFLERKGLIYAAGAIWLLLVLVPGLLAMLYQRQVLQQRYPAARRLARIISWLHPADGWLEQPQVIRAMELAQQGEFSMASDVLRRYEAAKSSVSLVAMPILYRITNEWEEFLAWEANHRHEMERCPQLLPFSLRARGETGNLHGLVELYDQRKDQIRRLSPPATRDFCRLMLFAFCGRRGCAERLFAGTLALLPPTFQKFWLAIADHAAGEIDAAKSQFETLLNEADPPTRRAIERRLARISVEQDAIGPTAERVLDSAAVEMSHEDRFGARPGLLSRHARATQLIILLNLLMFGGELLFGGSYNLESLYRLGALYPPAVRGGEWWRLVASLFLHYGPVHLAMNMVGLWVLAPFVEFALGARKFIVVYLVAGVASMGIVMALASGATGLTVGASGGVMGLVGATAALMLRGWLQEKAFSARRRLVAMFAIVVIQTISDAFIPQVSMTAHLSGAVFGFVTTMFVAHRLGVAGGLARTTAPQTETISMPRNSG